MFITVDGVACHYAQEGDGPDVLLLHGWGGEIGSFRPLFEALVGSFRVTALDFPGHGQSGRPDPNGWSVTEYTQWTYRVILALGITPCHIVAHSFGGRVSILLCATHPEVVRRLVLTGAHGIVAPKTIKQKLRSVAYRLLKQTVGRIKPIRNWLIQRFGSADYNALDDEMKKTFVKVVNQDLQAYLPQIQASTLLVWGSEDTATPLWFGKLMEEKIPDSGLVVYEGAGHFAYLERAAQFNRVVAHFLGEG